MDITETAEINQISTRYTFTELVDKYGDSIYRFCRSLTYSKEDADDLFQETFLKILEQPDKINNSGNPRSFLFSTALYIWKSWKRRYARRNRLAPVESLDNNANIGVNTTEEDYIALEEIKTTQKLVAALPEKFRIPVILYYTAEMSVSDIAAALKIPEGTVKSRLFTARNIIEKGLKHE